MNSRPLKVSASHTPQHLFNKAVPDGSVFNIRSLIHLVILQSLGDTTFFKRVVQTDTQTHRAYKWLQIPPFNLKVNVGNDNSLVSNEYTLCPNTLIDLHQSKTYHHSSLSYDSGDNNTSVCIGLFELSNICLSTLIKQNNFAMI